MNKKKHRAKKVAPKHTPKKTVQTSTPQTKEAATPNFVFGKKNYIVMFIGLAVIALGFILMSGGGSDDPNQFNEAVFSARRIHIAPMLVIIGFAIEIYAIMLNPKS